MITLGEGTLAVDSESRKQQRIRNGANGHEAALLTIRELARLVKLDEDVVRAAIRKGDIPSIEPFDGYVVASLKAARRYALFIRSGGEA